MYHLYVLKSQISTRHYIGITANIAKRIAEHNAGSVRSTKAYRPWTVVHIEEFPDKRSTKIRELFLKKTAKARIDLFNAIDRGAIV